MQPTTLQIQILPDGYHQHGCRMMPDANTDIVLIEYEDAITNHAFMGGYNRGGVYDLLKQAKKIMSTAYPEHTVLLGIPDLVCRVPKQEVQ